MKLRLQQNSLFFTFLWSFIWSWWTLDGVVSDPQLTRVKSGCSTYNVSNVNIFNENLNATMRSLREQVGNQSKHFATAMGEKGNNPAYGVFQCRNYLSIKDCLACFDFARVRIYDNCSIAATGARVIYEGCFLRYESGFYLDQSIDAGTHIMCGNGVAKNSTELASTVQQVLQNLVEATPRIPGFFAATITPVPNSNTSNIYAIAQCLETVTQSGCQDCLESGLRNFQICIPNPNAQIFYAGCYMRYSTSAFFAQNQITNIKHFLKQGSNKKGAIVGVVAGGVVFALILLTLIAWIKRTKRPERLVLKGDISGVSELNGPINFSYRELMFATEGFSPENKLGEGGFGAVYKGTLKNGKVVAVKKLTLHKSKKVDEEFETEVKLISNVHHRNLIQLLGYCSNNNERIIIYEYMKNTSLDKFLFGKNRGSLTWKQRYDIILGTARGLAYLHEESHIRILHRDIKTNNILLDNNLQPRIADFGLAKLLPEDKSHISTKFAGTLGYTAPEYAVYGQLSEKVDIYSYGVVVLEIISGQKCRELNADDDEGAFLLQKAWNLYKKERHLELVDKTLDPNSYDAEEVKKIIEIGLLCAQASSDTRPMMSDVIALLQKMDLLENIKPTMPNLLQKN